MPMLNLRIVLPDVVVSLARLQELKETRLMPTGLRIGALTTHAEIEDGRIPDLFGGLMRTVAAGISYRAIRKALMARLRPGSPWARRPQFADNDDLGAPRLGPQHVLAEPLHHLITLFGL